MLKLPLALHSWHSPINNRVLATVKSSGLAWSLGLSWKVLSLSLSMCPSEIQFFFYHRKLTPKLLTGMEMLKWSDVVSNLNTSPFLRGCTFGWKQLGLALRALPSSYLLHHSQIYPSKEVPITSESSHSPCCFSPARRQALCGVPPRPEGSCCDYITAISHCHHSHCIKHSSYTRWANGRRQRIKVSWKVWFVSSREQQEESNLESHNQPAIEEF